MSDEFLQLWQTPQPQNVITEIGFWGARNERIVILNDYLCRCSGGPRLGKAFFSLSKKIARGLVLFKTHMYLSAAKEEGVKGELSWRKSFWLRNYNKLYSRLFCTDSHQTPSNFHVFFNEFNYIVITNIY